MKKQYGTLLICLFLWGQCSAAENKNRVQKAGSVSLWGNTGYELHADCFTVRAWKEGGSFFASSFSKENGQKINDLAIQKQWFDAFKKIHRAQLHIKYNVFGTMAAISMRIRKGSSKPAC
jgi:hypothetical protein